MSIPHNSNPTISLQKANGQPPDLPPTDRYDSLLPQLLLKPRKCNASAGMSWLSKAVNMFKKEFLLWVGIGFMFFIITGLGGLIPYVGFLFGLLGTVFTGGVIKGCAAQARGEELIFSHLFSAFKTHFIPLIKLILLYIVGIIIVMIPMFAIVGGVMMLSDTGGQELTNTSVILMLLVMLLTSILIIPLIMSVWFAPALIVLHNIKPFTAMKMSFKAGLANIIPIIVFGLILSLLIPIFVIVTLGLGILVVIPVMMITYYTSYRDVWTDQPLSVL